MPNQRPNILFIVSDDHRHDAIQALAADSPTGDTAVQTPALDALLNSGAAFRCTHIMGSMTDAVCAPSRAALLTGVNPLAATQKNYIPVANGLMALNPALPLLPEIFREAGYASYGIGKWHNDKAGFNRAFADGSRIFLRGMSDHWQPPLHQYDPSGEYHDSNGYNGNGFSSTIFSDAAIDYLQSYQGEQPFFLYVSYTAPHDPRTAPAEFAARYDTQDIKLPENFLPAHPFDNGEMQVRDEKLANWPRNEQEIRQHLADYYAMVTHMDHEIGRVLECLRINHFADDTIVVYVADHGLAVGQHGLMGKQNLYNHSIRVPLIISGPGIPAGKRIDALHYSFDLFATLCAMADIPAPATLEGRNLLPLIEGSQMSLYDTVFCLYDDIQRAVSDGEWKLIRYRYSTRRAAGTNYTQLFNLSQDPWELNNLSDKAEYTEPRQRLERELSAWQRRVNDVLAPLD